MTKQGFPSVLRLRARERSCLGRSSCSAFLHHVGKVLKPRGGQTDVIQCALLPQARPGLLHNGWSALTSLSR